MENKVLSILLGGLIVAIIFHALALRYEMHPVGERGMIWRIDRLTGRIWFCSGADVVTKCSGGNYREPPLFS